MTVSEAYPVHDELVAPTELAQSDSEPTPVKLPLPISWRQSLHAALSKARPSKVRQAWCQAGFASARTASGRPKLRPASANQQVVLRWPDISGFFSTQACGLVIRCHHTLRVPAARAPIGGGGVHGADPRVHRLRLPRTRAPTRGASLRMDRRPGVRLGRRPSGNDQWRDRRVCRDHRHVSGGARGRGRQRRRHRDPLPFGDRRRAADAGRVLLPARPFCGAAATARDDRILQRPCGRHRTRAAPPVLRAKVRRLRLFRRRRGRAAQAEHWTVHGLRVQGGR